MSKLRYAVIGVGAQVWRKHREALLLPDVELVAVAEKNCALGRERALELGCAFYQEYQQMLASVRPDVVVILTPSALHAPMSIDALAAGCHVLVEKPMALQVADADAMIAAARQAQRQLGVIFQHRFRPEIQMAHRYVQQGSIGIVQRVTLTAACPRPKSYYTMAPWRGTWRGEGGGVVMNQAPHYLDLLCYLMGLPTRVFAWVRTRLHQIETEDTIHASLEWPTGALGSLHVSTAECSIAQAENTDYLQIIGTAGSIELHRDHLTICLLDTDIRHFIASTDPRPPFPTAHDGEVVKCQEGSHREVYQQFHEAIRMQSPDLFTSMGAQGRLSLELANALLLSGAQGRQVTLPLDACEYAAFLAEHVHACIAAQKS